MKIAKAISAIALAFSLTACMSTETATRNQVLDQTDQIISQDQLVTPEKVSWRVTDVEVIVPDELKVSEANLFYPGADIVWREDPLGDRKAQVKKILTDAITTGVASVDGFHPVKLYVEVRRFHSLTEKARYTVGGMHSIWLNVTVLDAATGQPVMQTSKIDASFNALGGMRAMEAVREGRTQKVRINTHVSNLMRNWIVTPHLDVTPAPKKTASAPRKTSKPI